MNVEYNYLDEPQLPEGYRFVKKGEIVKATDRYDFRNMWVEPDITTTYTSVNKKALMDNEFIRKIN